MALYVWGHNNAQQLGLGVDDKVVFDVRRVDALAREAVVDVSAGEQHTLAVTEFGDVFAWGRGKEGQLGLGRTVTAARTPARVTRGGLGGEHVVQVACGDAHSLALSADGRVFMWGLLPAAVGAPGGAAGAAGDDASDRAAVSLAGLSAALYEEQPALSPRSLRASMSDALTARLVVDSTRAFEGEAAPVAAPATRTVRRPAFVPRPSAALVRECVVEVAAGFAHSLAVTAAGRVLSCGYNDNGQLGSGSRRHAADFAPVLGLDGVRAARVACGQQHSLACGRRADGAEADGAVFAWGLGVLGQLGTGPGVPVAYRPVRVPVPAPAVAVAAGAHHSVAVTADGRAYSWGHSEYGQHGAAAGGGSSTDDLQRRANYFYPRLQAALADEDSAVGADGEADAARARDVACSAHSTFVVAAAAAGDEAGPGQLWSWGWNAFGALGNGKVQRSARPQRVAALATRDVRRAAAGANHAAAVVRPRGCHYALRLDAVLARGDFADVAVAVKGAPHVLLAHRAVLAARCAYLGGQLRAAAADADAWDEAGRLRLDALAGEDAAVARALLGFLYSARVDVAAHKRRALAALAARVHCEALAAICEDPWRRVDRRADPEGEAAAAFERDMAAALAGGELADVEFLWPVEGGGRPARVPAHRAVLAQVEYFRSMFLGGFSEADAGLVDGQREVSLAAMPRDGVTLAAFRRLLRWVYTGSFASLLPDVGDGDGEEDGEEEGPAATMDLLVAAGRLGVRELAALSERRLLTWLPRLARGDAGSLRACRDFGARFGARKLRAMSRRMLREAGEDEGEDEEEVDEEGEDE